MTRMGWLAHCCRRGVLCRPARLGSLVDPMMMTPSVKTRVCSSEEGGTDAEPAETADALRESRSLSVCSLSPSGLFGCGRVPVLPSRSFFL